MHGIWQQIAALRPLIPGIEHDQPHHASASVSIGFGSRQRRLKRGGGPGIAGTTVPGVRRPPDTSGPDTDRWATYLLLSNRFIWV